MDISKIRVNRVTVNVDKHDGTTISLYKTNNLLGILTEEDIDIPPFHSSGVSLKAYQMYCKDFVIELLNNDGIPGYYYEPKSESQSIKYDNFTFKNGIKEYVDSLLNNKYEYKMLATEDIDVSERYKNGYIKDAIGEFDVQLTQYDIKITIMSEIKSGQLCRPKIIKHNDIEYSFNITNIGRIIKSV